MSLDRNHKLYKLSKWVDWPYLESELCNVFKDEDRAKHRFMAGMVYLKGAGKLSSEEAVNKWETCPYWRYLCGGSSAIDMTEYPYSPYVLDIWTRSLEGQGYEVLISAMLRPQSREMMIQ